MPPTSSSSNHRGRRIDDALSQLVDSLLPSLSPVRRHRNGSDNASDAYLNEYARAEIAEAEELRHRRALDLAWRILDAHGTNNSGGGNHVNGSGEQRRGSVSPDVINNAPDMIKRKLLRENASPDKAVRFSNLYSRLLTQPVLGQKWAILYLLYRIRDEDEDDAVGMRDGEGVVTGGNKRMADGRRSPLMENNQLDHMLLKDEPAGRKNIPESIAPDSSVSVVGREQRRAAMVKDAMDATRPKESERKRAAGDENKERMQARRYAEEPIPVPQTPKQPPQADGNDEGAPPAEPALLRDLPFCLQGLSTTNLQFSNTTLKLPTTLPIPLLSLLHTLAEPCLLYRGLSTFAGKSEGGLIEQSLRAAIGSELRSYLGLVASLEGEIRTAVTAVTESTDDPQSVMKAGVTLKRCVVWMKDATMALRLMSLMVEELEGKKGGQLISMIHGFSTSHGDPFVGAFAERLLAHVTRPFYGMLTQWIYDGELSDPYREFFVVQPENRPDVDPRRTATSVWDEKYKLNGVMVPTIMTHDFAKKVFLIGKSLNFIRYGCGDSAWVIAYSRDASKELRYGDTATLETSIDKAYKTTMARLIYLMDSKFRLFEHLNALKKYLLLGQGDFIALLMESLASNLDRPANSQYRHTLTAQLEHAIRASNAQYDSPDVLRRLDARMLELSHGEIGWDCFTLEYKIDAPVDVVITPWASTQYLKLFNFLWRVKRVEFALGSTWRRCMTGARGVLGSVEDKVGPDWKRARCVIAEMIHFICQLQYYILFEVIEASWDQLQVAISKPECTLDDLIEAHTKYLNSITHKGLLGSSSSRGSSSSNRGEESFLAQLHQILKIMLAYKDAVDGLYSFSVAEFTRRQEFNAKIETRTAQGQWGVTERDFHSNQHSRSGSILRRPGTGSGSQTVESPLDNGGILRSSTDGTPLADTVSPFFSSGLTGEDYLLPSLRSRLSDLSAEFRARLITLLSDLAYQPDVDMRFLGVVMNFNDVYQVVRRRRGGGGGSGKDRERRRAGAESVERRDEKEKEKEKGKEGATA
ncbi:Spc97 / Spc98 family protein [Coccidioides posadasii C735 delta SOWgp]|uniref:Spc97 / Spc98 family protein n=1 Tax=Coccidioides posadasii (strain C735) TaxID=222929 RepID=C5P9B1_COCP7|nr:Spc97 / Spc98 family protein [Coccidioides posadasii C735 delta SOWgp]EER26323.1 Spc97 / Spc98 family protein [Coccidioides posadasii C735 delta SOWgp]|eukprot:XP_003068468.1 Spc97 / Spc98 family protein [Coccidioides posadasii C735 delta SOWgp]